MAGDGLLCGVVVCPGLYNIEPVLRQSQQRDDIFSASPAVGGASKLFQLLLLLFVYIMLEKLTTLALSLQQNYVVSISCVWWCQVIGGYVGILGTVRYPVPQS